MVVWGLSARSMSMGTSLVLGLTVAGIFGIALELAEVPVGSAVGAFVGGIIAAWLLYARRGRALVVGFLVGVFSFPVQLLMLIALISSGLYTPPPAPEMPADVLLTALAATLIIQVVAGTLGGLLGGILHRPPPRAEGPRPYLPPPPPSPDKYCIQCGAGLAKQTPVCPACGARQPS